MFYVRQEVVCINDNWRPVSSLVKSLHKAPRKNLIYTITGIEFSPVFRADFLTLEGWPQSVWFDGRHFRPVVKTDISVFTAMLEKPPAPLPSQPVRETESA